MIERRVILAVPFAIFLVLIYFFASLTRAEPSFLTALATVALLLTGCLSRLSIEYEVEMPYLGIWVLAGVLTGNIAVWVLATAMGNNPTVNFWVIALNTIGDLVTMVIVEALGYRL